MVASDAADRSARRRSEATPGAGAGAMDLQRRCELAETRAARSAEQMKKLRDAYFKELMHLREQLHAKAAAEEKGLEDFKPSHEVFFDPADFASTEEVQRLVETKVRLMQQELTAKVSETTRNCDRALDAMRAELKRNQDRNAVLEDLMLRKAALVNKASEKLDAARKETEVKDETLTLEQQRAKRLEEEKAAAESAYKSAQEHAELIAQAAQEALRHAQAEVEAAKQAAEAARNQSEATREGAEKLAEEAAAKAAEAARQAERERLAAEEAEAAAAEAAATKARLEDEERQGGAADDAHRKSNEERNSTVAALAAQMAASAAAWRAEMIDAGTDAPPAGFGLSLCDAEIQCDDLPVPQQESAGNARGSRGEADDGEPKSIDAGSQTALTGEVSAVGRGLLAHEAASMLVRQAQAGFASGVITVESGVQTDDPSWQYGALDFRQSSPFSDDDYCAPIEEPVQKITPAAFGAHTPSAMTLRDSGHLGAISKRMQEHLLRTRRDVNGLSTDEEIINSAPAVAAQMSTPTQQRSSRGKSESFSAAVGAAKSGPRPKGLLARQPTMPPPPGMLQQLVTGGAVSSSASASSPTGGAGLLVAAAAALVATPPLAAAPAPEEADEGMTIAGRQARQDPAEKPIATTAKRSTQTRNTLMEVMRSRAERKHAAPLAVETARYRLAPPRATAAIGPTSRRRRPLRRRPRHPSAVFGAHRIPVPP
eukprot:TRINITY_DN4683_c1_g1_i1.p1 TRINITY_DN4683_c1_g1~~TRINITY_DN4683_c1_g1_i1.p1  ORF type:complete len:714 (+),score=188.97 TRINITY_DN4683_c1_g1_i1:171-2312(+)